MNKPKPDPLVARARHAFTRLVGLELGDALADELYEARVKRAASADTHRNGQDHEEGLGS